MAIGIPTRNRAQLAIDAIDSVLRSARPGVAVVVSDNSTEETEAARLADACAARPGVRYVRPPEPLPMAEHWEWLWDEIQRQVAPSHVAYLTDRLVFASGALERLLEVVASDPGQVVSYHFDTVLDLAPPVGLVQTPWTGAVYELDCGTLAELSSRGEFAACLPRLMNSVVPVEVGAAIRERFGGLFGPRAPDYRFAFRCLALRDTILYLDRACVIEHGLIRSQGTAYRRGALNADARRFARELSEAPFGATPEPAFETNANAIFQEYCAVRAEPGGAGLPAVDRASYLATNAVSVALIEDPDWRARMRELLATHGWTRGREARRRASVALRMAAYLARRPRALGRAVGRRVRRGEPSFGSDREAIAYAGTHPRPATADAWHIHVLRRAGAVVTRRR